MPDTPDTCGRKPYPEKKVADSKIGCLSNNAGDGYENVSQKGIRAASNFIAFIPFRLLRQMLADVVGVEF